MDNIFTDPLKQITEYAYDNRGNLLSLKDSKGNVATFEYDRNNRLTKETRPLGQATRNFYNPVGGLDYKIDAKKEMGRTEMSEMGSGNGVGPRELVDWI